MLDKVKVSLRISKNNTAYDDEIKGLIRTCKKELEMSGIVSFRINEADSLIAQAIIYYCKANFGYDNPDSEKYFKSYEDLKKLLCLNYKNNGVD